MQECFDEVSRATYHKMDDVTVAIFTKRAGVGERIEKETEPPSIQ